MLQTTLYGNTPTVLNDIIKKALRGYGYILVYNGSITKVYRLEGLYKTAYLTTELRHEKNTYSLGVTLEADPVDYPQLSISLIQSGSLGC